MGLSLTGGLDTRIVMAGIPADAEPMPAYTYGGVYRDCFDVEVARKVAAACGQQHTVLPLDSDFFERFDTFAEETVWLTDGCLRRLLVHTKSTSANRRVRSLQFG